MIRSVATAEPEAIVVMCTNVPGAEVAAALATELGLPILDSAAVTLSID